MACEELYVLMLVGCGEGRARVLVLTLQQLIASKLWVPQGSIPDLSQSFFFGSDVLDFSHTGDPAIICQVNSMKNHLGSIIHESAPHPTPASKLAGVEKT